MDFLQVLEVRNPSSRWCLLASLSPCLCMFLLLVSVCSSPLLLKDLLPPETPYDPGGYISKYWGLGFQHERKRDTMTVHNDLIGITFTDSSFYILENKNHNLCQWPGRRLWFQTPMWEKWSKGVIWVVLIFWEVVTFVTLKGTKFFLRPVGCPGQLQCAHRFKCLL